MARITTVAAPLAHLVGPGRLHVVNARLAYTAVGELPLRLDAAALRSVYCYGGVTVTDEAMALLFHHGVELAWLTQAGTRCRGRVVRAEAAGTTLRLAQYRALTQPALRRDWAAAVVAAKLDSQLAAARHYQRHGDATARDVMTQVQALRARCEAADLEALRGLEGAGSLAWFRLLGRLVAEPFRFEQRSRRPPLDPVNALLSLGYTFLLTRTVARCEAAGLEVALGGLHELRPGRPSLACDLMEPLRVTVDRWVLLLCNQQRVGPGDFTAEGGGVRLQPGRFATILHHWEESWQGQGSDERLDEWVESRIAWLRQCSPAPAEREPDDL
jgi:CRISPR-associated protein Cas1